MASETNKSFVSWKTNYSRGSDTTMNNKSGPLYHSEAEERSVSTTPATIVAASSRSTPSGLNPDSSDLITGKAPWNISQSWNFSQAPGDAKIRVDGYRRWNGSDNEGRRNAPDSFKPPSMERASHSNDSGHSSNGEAANPELFHNSKQLQPPPSSGKRSKHNPATKNKQLHGQPIHLQKPQHPTNSGNPFKKQFNHTAVNVRKAVPHAEDLQPNEGFTGVKTTIAPGVPKVLSTSTSSAGKFHPGSKNGRGGWTSPKRGNWASKRGEWSDWGGRPGRNPPGSSMRPVHPSPLPSNLSPSSHDPPTPHHLPSAALNKALNNHSGNPQKRKIPPNPDHAVSISSPMGISSLSNGSNTSVQRIRKEDFSHLLPAGPWKTVKRRKLQEQESRKETMVINTEEVTREIWDRDPARVVESVESIADGTKEDVLDDCKDHDSAQRDGEEVTSESSDSHFGLVYPPSSPAPFNPPPNALATIQLNDSSEIMLQLASGVDPMPATAMDIKDEPLDLELGDLPPPSSPTSGTKRYHPIPQACHKFFSTSSFPPAISSSSSKSNPNAHQDLKTRLMPNPHYRSARAEVTKRAIAELCAEGLVVRRVLWRDDGFCLDWEKKAVVSDYAGLASGGEKSGKGGATDVETRNKIEDADRSRTGKEVSKPMETIFDGLLSIADELDLVQVKSEPQPDPTLPVASKADSNPQSPGSQSLSQAKESESPVIYADVDIIDLTIDEKASTPPPLSNFTTPLDYTSEIGREGNNANDDIRLMYKPPLVVHLGSGRTPNPDSSHSREGRSAPAFLLGVPPRLGANAPSIVDTELSPRNKLTTDTSSGVAHPPNSRPNSKPESEHQSTSQSRSVAHVPVSQTAASPTHLLEPPISKTHPHIDDLKIQEFNGRKISSPNRGADDSRDLEEELQVRDELDFDLELKDPDMEVMLDSEDEMDLLRPLEQSSDSIEFVETPISSSIGSSRPPKANADRTLGKRNDTILQSPSFDGRPNIERLAVDTGEKARMEGLAIDFLRRYINSWEYDRPCLSRAYTPNAVFSCSVILPEASSGTSLHKSPTHIFASHFNTSTSAFNLDPSSASPRPLQGPPVPIQTPAVITPALLLLDPQRAYTFFPGGGQAEVAYDILYLGNLQNSFQKSSIGGRSPGAMTYLGVQAELKRKIPEAEVKDDILDLLNSQLDRKGKGKASSNEPKLCIGWNFVLCGRCDENDEFPLHIISHQMMVRDGF